MKHLPIVLLFLIIYSCKQQALSPEYHRMYVASNGAENTAGISVYGWDADKGSLDLLHSDTTIKNSGYLTIDTIRNVLYSINQKSISSLKIQVNGSLSLMNELPLNGKAACFVSVSNDGQYLMVAYYSSGNISSYSINKDGSLGKLIANIQHEGSSVNQSRQESAHPHMIMQVPNSNLVIVPDLGLDKVLVYEINDAGILSPNGNDAEIMAGGGPRHLVLHPTGNYAYVLHELTGHVTGYAFDRTSGFQHSFQTISTLPVDFKAFNKSADIHITPNGQYLYASNRGDNSLAVFEIDPLTGKLNAKGILSCGGEWPRAFAIDPTGAYILVANKRSDQISILKIDYATGLFDKINEVPTSKEPQGIRFIRVK